MCFTDYHCILLFSLKKKKVMFCLKSKESSFLSDKMGGMLKGAFRSGIVYRASRDNVFNSEKHLAE